MLIQNGIFYELLYYIFPIEILTVLTDNDTDSKSLCKERNCLCKIKECIHFEKTMYFIKFNLL